MIELPDLRLMLMTPPKTKQILPPLFRVAVFETVLALANAHPGSREPCFDGVQISRLPKTEVDGIIGDIITVMEVDQIVSPDITLLGRIVKIGAFHLCR